MSRAAPQRATFFQSFIYFNMLCYAQMRLFQGSAFLYMIFGFKLKLEPTTCGTDVHLHKLKPNLQRFHLQTETHDCSFGSNTSYSLCQYAIDTYTNGGKAVLFHPWNLLLQPIKSDKVLADCEVSHAVADE